MPASPPVDGDRRPSLVICGAIFLGLLIWLIIWPYTGEDDSVLHYLNAREAATSPAAALGAWARPLFKLMLAWPATQGIFVARIFQAILTTVLAWQVIQLARDLGFARPWLAAGMLIWQPMVFALGSDTMSELPFALGATIALRLWNSRRLEWLCLLCGLLPMVRPEGFLLMAGSVLMVLLVAGPAKLPRRVGAAFLAGTGMLAWAIACAAIVGNWHYFLDVWSWPFSGYESYGRGSLFHHIVRWPWYCGWILFPLFCVGIYPAFRRRLMWPAAGFWLIVLLGHSILFWRGWLASIGQMRILTTTAPVTALICLEGWNILAARNLLPRIAAVLAATLATVWIGVEYASHVRHYQCFVVRDVSEYMSARHLLDNPPVFFTSEKMVLAMLDLPDRAVPMTMNRLQTINQLRHFPGGAIGMWDSRNGASWYGINIDELPLLGFEVLHESRRTVWDRPEALLEHGWSSDLRCVLLRKLPESP